ncbi:MAG: cell division protein ZapA [Methylacidiphilales bacterium]|nr:cell division protein ZapA [Candidatus Methylacidiphilales bacterium]
MTEKVKVNIQILSQELRVSCLPEEQELLRDLVTYIENEAKKLNENGNIPINQLFPLISLTLAKEIFDLQKTKELLAELVSEEQELGITITNTIANLKKSFEE